jgi:hypothetical protein
MSSTFANDNTRIIWPEDTIFGHNRDALFVDDELAQKTFILVDPHLFGPVAPEKPQTLFHRPNEIHYG